MPIGILGSLVICTILYIVVAAVLTGLVSYHNLDVRDPLAVGIDSTGVRWGSLLVKIGALMGLSSTIVVMLLGQSRVFFSMSKDGLLPALFSRVHTKFRTPWISSLTVGTFVAALAASLPINVLDEMVSIGTSAGIRDCLCGRVADSSPQSRASRPFKTPWVPFVPIMGILISHGHDGQPHRAYLDSSCGLAGDRHGAVFQLWSPSQPRAARYCGGSRRAKFDTETLRHEKTLRSLDASVTGFQSFAFIMVRF